MIPELQPLRGKYEILSKLREGGMGAIFLVRHRLLGDLRVVKILRAQLQAEQEFRDRFAREARVAIQLRHSNIAQLYDFAVDDEGSGYMVLEYVEGRTLQELIAGRRLEQVPLVLEIAGQALDALGFLHRRGFVHRDVAPDNLMLSKDADGEPLVKLIDLGIVKILRGEDGRTATQVFLGKVRYASPEQFESSRIDGRSDLYSFGVLLYEMLTGSHPFPGGGMHSMISGHMLRPPRPFEETDPGGKIPAPLRRLVLDALAKDPDARPQTAEEFAARLRAIEREPVDLAALVAGLDLDVTVGLVDAAAGEPDSAQRALDHQFGRDRMTPEPETLTETEPGRGREGSSAGDLLVARKLDEWRALLDEGPSGASRFPRPGLRGWLALAALAVAAGVALLVRPGGGSSAEGPAPGPPPAAAAASAPEPERPALVARAEGPVEPEKAGAGSRTEIETAAPTGPAAAPAPESGWLRIDAAPWGEVIAVFGPGDRSVTLPGSASTPLAVRVPPGSYRVRIRDPRTGRSRETVVSVAAGSSAAAFVALAPIDAEEYFRSMGFEP